MECDGGTHRATHEDAPPAASDGPRPDVRSDLQPPSTTVELELFWSEVVERGAGWCEELRNVTVTSQQKRRDVAPAQRGAVLRCCR